MVMTVVNVEAPGGNEGPEPFQHASSALRTRAASSGKYMRVVRSDGAELRKDAFKVEVAR